MVNHPERKTVKVPLALIEVRRVSSSSSILVVNEQRTLFRASSAALYIKGIEWPADQIKEYRDGKQSTKIDAVLTLNHRNSFLFQKIM